MFAILIKLAFVSWMIGISIALPTARAKVSLMTVEETRLESLGDSQPELAELILEREGVWARRLSQLRDYHGALKMVQSLGQALWQSERHNLQSGLVFDDRPLYWQRLALTRLIRIRGVSLGFSAAETASVIRAFEGASQGRSNVSWHKEGARRILLTGFDPFALDRNLGQSNPSGLIALALDGEVIEAGGEWFEINAVLFPVRYADFDEGVLEDWLTPILLGSRVALLATISMGRDQFDLERYPGRRRSSAALDNLRRHTGGSLKTPQVPFFRGEPIDGPEFMEFSLPVDAMQRVKGDFKVRDNRRVVTLERGALTAKTLRELQDQIAVAGSGGGYLSNEISYRSLILAKNLQLTLPIGHIHTPRVLGFDVALERKIVDQTRKLILAAVKHR